MKKLFFIKNQEVFQGQKFLNTNKNYFEGWYFKHSSRNNSIAFIPGINISNKTKKAFIQVITNDLSFYIDYDIKDFYYSNNPFYIKIKDNFFSKEKININIIDEKQNIKIKGKITYSNNQNIKKTFYSPNIMGPFSYLSFMECNHAILSMKNKLNGTLTINNNKINFNNGIGYIEKDWGCSFPKSYIWFQGNNFKNKTASFMLSIAKIPFSFFSFNGIICSLIINNKEFRFSTYNNTKIIKYNLNNNNINVILKKGSYYLKINSTNNKKLELIAPIKGKMEKAITESISSTINVTLIKNKKIIFKDTSNNCGLEIVSK